MMKKTNIVCAFITLLVAVICVFSLLPKHQYYYDGYATYNHLSLYNLEDPKAEDKKTPVDSLDKQYVLRIFEELSQIYGVEKNAPLIGHFHPYDSIIARYSKGYIYIDFENYEDIMDAKSDIAHELIHYLSDNL